MVSGKIDRDSDGFWEVVGKCVSMSLRKTERQISQKSSLICLTEPEPCVHTTLIFLLLRKENDNQSTDIATSRREDQHSQEDDNTVVTIFRSLLWETV